MIKYLIKIAIRNLFRDKVYTLINIIGLTIGLTCSFFMLIYVLNEHQYDQCHKKRDRIYRVIIEKTSTKTKSPLTPLILGPTLKEEFPEIEKITRIYLFNNLQIKNGTEYENTHSLYCADNDIFDIFTIPILTGDKPRLLVDPNSIVLSEKMARKYFGEPNPIDKKIVIKFKRHEYTLKVTGIMKDLPVYSTFRPEMLINISWALKDLEETFHDDDVATDWNMDFNSTYILLKENNRIEELKNKMHDFEQKHSSQGNHFKLSFQPISDIYLYSDDLVNNNAPSGDYKSTNFFSIIALLILFIATINYIILSTACADRRTKEIGMRKVFGANNWTLARQMLSESVLITFFTLPLAILLVKIFLPYVNKLFDKNLIFTLSEGSSYLFWFALITLLIGLFSGAYISVHIVRSQPILMLRNRIAGKYKNYFSKIMVIIQLIIFIILSIYTSVIYKQLHYIHSLDMGYNKENLLIINCFGIGEKYTIYKNEIKKNHNVINVCAAQDLPPTIHSMIIPCPSPENPNKVIILECLSVDIDFIKTFEIKIIESSDYLLNNILDTSCALINQTTVKEFGIKSPIGYRITYEGGYKGPKIIGVINDFNFHSIHTKIPPIQIGAICKNEYINKIAVRIKPTNKAETIMFLENKWKEFSKKPFDFYFIDDIMNNMYKKEYKTVKIMSIFSFFAIFIAMLGLFGLSMFSSKQRTKEIGIRKVNGASINNIIFLLSKEYFILVIISNIIASPVSYYFVSLWLNNFAYQTPIEWWLFAGVLILSLAIVLLTISWQAYKAAKTNPVETLKYE